MWSAAAGLHGKLQGSSDLCWHVVSAAGCCGAPGQKVRGGQPLARCQSHTGDCAWSGNLIVCFMLVIVVGQLFVDVHQLTMSSLCLLCLFWKLAVRWSAGSAIFPTLAQPNIHPLLASFPPPFLLMMHPWQHVAHIRTTAVMAGETLEVAVWLPHPHACTSRRSRSRRGAQTLGAATSA